MHPAAAFAPETSSLPALAPAAAAPSRKAVRFEQLERDHFDSPVTSSGESSDDAATFSDDDLSDDLDLAIPADHAPGVLRDEASWAGNLPAAQGLVSVSLRREVI